MTRRLRTKLVVVSVALLSPLVFLLDHIVPKRRQLWVFGLGRPGQWHGNAQAVYEAVRDRADVHAVVVARRILPPALDHERDRTAIGWRTLWPLLRAGVIVVHHGSSDIPFGGITRHGRIIVNVWHGIPLKGILYTGWNDIDKRTAHMLTRRTRFNSAVIASSTTDRLAMAASMRLPLSDVWITGLPRNDWLKAPEDTLPADVRDALGRLRNELNGRRLVLYAPTFRDEGSGIYQFSAEERTALSTTLAKHGAVLGVRTHMNEQGAAELASEPWALDVSPARYPETQVVLRCTDVLVSDYSSIWIDFLVLDRPIIGFVHDLSLYTANRNLLYDIEDVYGGPLVADAHGLIEGLECGLAGQLDTDAATRRADARRVFFAYADAHATKRTVERILQESGGMDVN